MKTFRIDELKEILRLHGVWLRDEDGGKRADLRGAYLRGAYLRGVDLRGAYLQRADLRGAYLQGVDLRGVVLQGVYLQGAYLRGADLRGADLQGATGQNIWIKTLGSDIWEIVYTFDRLQIGCENHLITEWWEFDNDKISEMDHQALEFWKRWKPILQSIIANNPAQATGKEQ